MAQGRSGLSKIQLGRETVPGTSVPATTTWRGNGNMLDDQRKVKIIEEMVGILGGTDRSAIIELMGAIKLAPTEATFEQLQYILAMGFGGPTSGAADGVGTDKIYVTPIPTTSTASMTGKTYTARTGDDHEAEIMEYAFCSEFTLKGAIREAVKIEAVLMGRQVQTSSFTTLATLPDVDEVLVQLGKVYLDPIASAYGTTQVANQITGFEIKVKTGLKPIFTMDGVLYFSQILATDPEISGKLTFLHDTAANGASGEKSNWRNEVSRSLRLKFEHSAAVATTGTIYTKKSVLVDLPIKWTSFGTLEEKDSGSIVTGEFVSKYNTVKGDSGRFTVVNELSTLT